MGGGLPVGFAGGTPTHTCGFGMIADFLADNPSARFVLVVNSNPPRFDMNLASPKIGNHFLRSQARAKLNVGRCTGNSYDRLCTCTHAAGLLVAEASERRGLCQELAANPIGGAKLGESSGIDARKRFGPGNKERLAKILLAAVWVPRSR